MNAALSVEALRVAIPGDEGEARILDRIDLRLQPGRILGVVGESGCGKSTLIRTILGILPCAARIDAGAVIFENQDLLTLGERQMLALRGTRIGFIPQDPFLAFNPLFKVGTQLLEILRRTAANGPRLPLRERRERLLGLLRRVRLPDPEGAMERYPHQFSGGQRQRLLIAAALAGRPTLVIADEPTTALDVTTQREILLLLRDLATEFATSMLFVTHDLGVVSELCDDMCVIYAGQTVEAGPTRRVLADPLHPYTRALLACHPERSEGFTGIPGLVPSPLRAPPGCRFAPRCTAVRPGCAARAPRFAQAAPEHLVNCIQFDTEAA